MSAIKWQTQDTSSPEFRSAMRLNAIWSTAILDAWQRGEAVWAYEEAPGGVAGTFLRNVAGRVWGETFAATGTEKKAAEAVRDFAMAHGIDPKHKSR